MSTAKANSKKMLKLTILVIAMFQMPTQAISPAIARIVAQFGQELVVVQTALQIPNLVSPFASIIATIILNRSNGRVSKKAAILFGLSCIVVAATGMVLYSNAFWTLYLWGALVGVGIGTFIPSTFSLIMDCFDDEERRSITGLQTSFINIGGIIMSVLGGILADVVWYGGYLTFYLGLPIIAMCAIFLPGRKNAADAVVPEKAATGEKSKFNWNVAFYGVIIFFFMMMSVVSGSNISVYVIDQLGLGTAGTVGIITAVQMFGGVVSGFAFRKTSARCKDYTVALAFMLLFIGFGLLGLARSLPLIFLGAFIAGGAMSWCVPQCIFSISLYVDEKSSTFASTIASSIAPSLGGFLSPRVFTTLTTALFGVSISSRYLFMSGLTLFCCLLLFVIMTVRKKKGFRGW